MEGFRHEALLYAGEQEFVDGTVPFIHEAVAAGEPIMVVVDGPKLDLLRSRLNGESERVIFSDMREVGENPARIIPAWEEFVNEHAGAGRLRGIGEPIGPGRGESELDECHRHESLINLAFENADDFWLMCPYDVEALSPSVVAEAQFNHPHLVDPHGARAESPAWCGPEQVRFPYDRPLPEPGGEPRELRFDVATLPLLRRFAARLAARAGLAEQRISDLLLAVNEVATNSVKHGGGHGLLRVWQEPDRVVCEVRDAGLIDSPLAGRRRPDPTQGGGRGLWLANQLCHLVQLRSFAEGSVVRLHMRI
jgi:anti-sigma regulatory factor (Ser/Thr protein kinase)